MITNRTVIANTTVRFFFNNSDAVKVAKNLTRSCKETFAPVQARYNGSVQGWLVQQATTKQLHDSDGALPAIVMDALKV